MNEKGIIFEPLPPNAITSYRELSERYDLTEVQTIPQAFKDWKIGQQRQLPTGTYKGNYAFEGGNSPSVFVRFHELEELARGLYERVDVIFPKSATWRGKNGEPVQGGLPPVFVLRKIGAGRAFAFLNLNENT